MGISVLDSVHGLATAPDVTDGVVHRVVEQGVDVLLVRTDVGWVTVEAFTNLEDASCLSILGPKIFWNMWDRVDSDSIKLVFVDEVLDPVLKILSHPLVLL